MEEVTEQQEEENQDFFFFKEEIPDVFGKINLIGTQFYLTLFLNSYATICDSSGLKPRARSHF